MIHPLGRNGKTDDARDFGLAELKARPKVPMNRKVVSILDQGDEGICVAAGILGAINCALGYARFGNADLPTFFDQIPGHGARPDGGAEIRQGLATAKKLGYIDSYGQLATKAAQDEWIEGHGPVVWGLDWYSGMDSPDAKGYVQVTGYVRGGHCTYGSGDLGLEDDDVNSWGEGWAAKGRFDFAVGQTTKIRNGDFEAWGFTLPAQPAPAPTPTPQPTPAPEPLAERILDALIDGLTYLLAALKKAVT